MVFFQNIIMTKPRRVGASFVLLQSFASIIVLVILLVVIISTPREGTGTLLSQLFTFIVSALSIHFIKTRIALLQFLTYTIAVIPFSLVTEILILDGLKTLTYPAFLI